MNNPEGVQEPTSIDINTINRCTTLNRTARWTLTVKEDGFGARVVVTEIFGLCVFLATSGNQLALHPTLEQAMSACFKKLKLHGTFYCEWVCAPDPRYNGHGFDRAVKFANRTANPITLSEFTENNCRVVALYEGDYGHGGPSAVKRMSNVRRLPQILSDNRGVVKYPRDVVVCVEILCSPGSGKEHYRGISTEDAVSKARAWVALRSLPSATLREGLVMIDEKSHLKRFGQLTKTSKNYRNPQWLKLKSHGVRSQVTVESYNMQTHKARCLMKSEDGCLEMPVKSSPVHTDSHHTTLCWLEEEEDRKVRAEGFKIDWYVGRPEVRWFIIYSLRKHLSPEDSDALRSPDKERVPKAPPRESPVALDEWYGRLYGLLCKCCQTTLTTDFHRERDGPYSPGPPSASTDAPGDGHNMARLSFLCDDKSCYFQMSRPPAVRVWDCSNGPLGTTVSGKCLRCHEPKLMSSDEHHYSGYADPDTSKPCKRCAGPQAVPCPSKRAREDAGVWDGLPGPAPKALAETSRFDAKPLPKKPRPFRAKFMCTCALCDDGVWSNCLKGKNPDGSVVHLRCIEPEGDRGVVSCGCGKCHKITKFTAEQHAFLSRPSDAWLAAEILREAARQLAPQAAAAQVTSHVATDDLGGISDDDATEQKAAVSQCCPTGKPKGNEPDVVVISDSDQERDVNPLADEEPEEEVFFKGRCPKCRTEVWSNCLRVRNPAGLYFHSRCWNDEMPGILSYKCKCTLCKFEL